MSLWAIQNCKQTLYTSCTPTLVLTSWNFTQSVPCVVSVLLLMEEILHHPTCMYETLLTMGYLRNPSTVSAQPPQPPVAVALPGLHSSSKPQSIAASSATFCALLCRLALLLDLNKLGECPSTSSLANLRKHVKIHFSKGKIKTR